MKGLSPRPKKNISFQNQKENVKQYAQVSQRIGNSLCSHPALLMSAFGGIFKDISRFGRFLRCMNGNLVVVGQQDAMTASHVHDIAEVKYYIIIC